MLADGRGSTGSDRMHGRFVHPFDDDDFISGNGTVGLEIIEDLPDVDAVVAPLGGGGLLAGIAAVIEALQPDARVYAAEPETAAPLSVSLARGQASRFDGWQSSFVDGAGGKSVLADDVAAAPGVGRRIDRRLAGRRGARRCAGGRPRPRDCRRAPPPARLRPRFARRARRMATRKWSRSSPAATSISRVRCAHARGVNGGDGGNGDEFTTELSEERRNKFCSLLSPLTLWLDLPLRLSVDSN